MLPATLEKLSFGVVALVLYAQGRVAALVAGAGIIDVFVRGVLCVGVSCFPERRDLKAKPERSSALLAETIMRNMPATVKAVSDFEPV